MNCDVCNDPTSWEDGTVYTADEFRRLAAKGFLPDQGYMNIMSNLGVDRQTIIAQWKQGIVAHTETDWLLCPSCAARAAGIMPRPAGTGPRSGKLVENLPASAFRPDLKTEKAKKRWWQFWKQEPSNVADKRIESVPLEQEIYSKEESQTLDQPQAKDKIETKAAAIDSAQDFSALAGPPPLSEIRTQLLAILKAHAGELARDRLNQLNASPKSSSLPQLCPGCKQAVEPVNIGGITYCPDCGVAWGQKQASFVSDLSTPKQEQQRLCTHCKNLVFPSVIAGHSYCPQCGSRI